jgi:short subunit dehydrogenase-like uncharacterized protein
LKPEVKILAEAQWMIYGANGYTGRLMTEEAVNLGLKPVLAGRSEPSIKDLADKYQLPYRIFSLDNPEIIAGHLEGIKVLLLAAGPFSATSRPAVDACLKTKTHYIDITGEISVFEACAARHREAQEAGIIIMPGAGFDVVPSDCLAASLHLDLPDAESLTLAIDAVNTPSAGTMKTMVEGFSEGGLVRRDGKLTRVPTAWKISKIPFKTGEKWAMTIPWGDVSTAYHSTGIPNIAVYMSAPKGLIRIARLTRLFAGIFAWKLLQDFIKSQIEKRVKGPTEVERKNSRSILWGRVENKQGESREGFMETIEGYWLTAKTGVDIARRLLEENFEPGYYTPSKLLGPDYILKIGGSKLEIRSGN